ncbi:glycosyltransferase family 61 protein [Sphingomonas sp. ID0503]|uniref:glycosyltransferase family 61 protein n=1 Tax=Sphingomonas sp. ID0503 TaxID=3399691 RepID=UPI003AFA9151
MRFEAGHLFAATELQPHHIPDLRALRCAAADGIYQIGPAPDSRTLSLEACGEAAPSASALYMEGWRDRETKPIPTRMVSLKDALHLGQDCLANAAGRTFAQSTVHGGKPVRGDVIVREGRRFVARAEVRIGREFTRPVLYLGTIPKQFGHFLLDLLPRLWPVQWAKEYGYEIVAHADYDLSRATYQSPFFEAVGLSRGDVTILNEPARFSRLFKPLALYDLHRGANPAFFETCMQVTEILSARLATYRQPERVYLSRRCWGKRRILQNEEAVEALFQERGYEIVFPEQLSVLEQMAAVASAKHLAGAIGSQTYLALFQRRPETAIILAPMTFTFADDAIIAAYRQARCGFVLGTPSDMTQSPRNQDYSVDMDEVARALDTMVG